MLRGGGERKCISANWLVSGHVSRLTDRTRARVRGFGRLLDQQPDLNASERGANRGSGAPDRSNC